MAFGPGEPFPGPYNRANFPYFDGILQALSPDDQCRYVSFLGSAQIGKTVLANIFALGSIVMGTRHNISLSPDDRQCSSLVKAQTSTDDAQYPCGPKAFPAAAQRYKRCLAV